MIAKMSVQITLALLKRFLKRFKSPSAGIGRQGELKLR